MKKSFDIPFKPWSINDLYYANKRHGKKQAAIEWGYEIFHFLNQRTHLKKFQELRGFFDPKKHYYEVDLKFFFPYNKLFTQDGRMKTPDLSNIEKPLIDLIFLPEYFKKEAPFGVKNLNIDDKYIGKLTSRKRVCKDDKYHTIISLKIKDLDLIK